MHPPGDALFHRDERSLTPSDPRPDIKYNKLVLFQWPEEGTFTQRKALEAVAVTKKLLEDNKFKKDDYLDILLYWFTYF